MSYTDHLKGSASFGALKDAMNTSGADEVIISYLTDDHVPHCTVKASGVTINSTPINDTFRCPGSPLCP